MPPSSSETSYSSNCRRKAWSVKAASDISAPLDGQITEVNDAIVANPALVNEDPLEDGWFFKMTLNDPSELEGLMDEEAYRAYIA
jgi:glycine cleavage system H protein